MRYSLKAATLLVAINLIGKAVAPKHLNVRATAKHVTLGASENGKSLSIRLPGAVVDQPGEFTTLPDLLAGVCRGRGDITLSMEDAKVVVTAKSYKGDIASLPFEEVTITDHGGTSLAFSDTELGVLLDLCNRVQLSAPYADGSPMLPVLVSLTEQGVKVACSDAPHAVVVTTKQLTGDNVELRLPPNALNTVAAVTKVMKSLNRISLSDSMLYAEGDGFKLALPLEQPSGALDMQHIDRLRASIKKAQEGATVATVNLAALQTILGNAYAVSEQSVPLEFQVREGSLHVATRTNYGMASEGLDAQTEGQGDFKFNIALINEIFDKLEGEEITLNFLPKLVYISVKTGAINSLYVIARSQ